MKQVISSRRPKSNDTSGSLVVRLDKASKALLARAAKLRRISISDYVRAVTVPQARREVELADRQAIALSPDELHAFWAALNRTPRLTRAQRRLGAIMRGKASTTRRKRSTKKWSFKELPGRPYRLFISAKQLEAMMEDN